MLAAPLSVEAQKIYRIGVLETKSIALNAANFGAFRQGLLQFGYVEGRNLELAYRSSSGGDDQFAGLASELVRLKVDLILARGTPATLAAKNASRTIPVVMTGIADPVLTGIVASLGRPGGNVTGLTTAIVELHAKRLQMLKELLPKITRVATLMDMRNLASAPIWKVTVSAARSLGIEPQLLELGPAKNFESAFEAAVAQRVDALLVGLDPAIQANVARFVELAAKHRLPAIYAAGEFVDAGGLMSYAPSYPHMYRKAATYVDRIFKGAKPADLPIELPTQFELAINLRTAKALGIKFPPAILLRADRVVE
ncbi:MAG: ABC transporter substrate-binding protein [Betaproteobacteria bacterium]|nr:ABC transporter substrate-binding protein [Betaproteobacteria bacterium]